MSIKIIQPAERVYHKEWVLFYANAGEKGRSGFAFPCDPDGTIHHLNPAAQDSLDYCLKHPEKFDPPEVQHREWSHFEYAVAQCHCGRKITLSDPLDNTCECGRCFNMSGQEVIPSWECDAQGNPYEYD